MKPSLPHLVRTVVFALIGATGAMALSGCGYNQAGDATTDDGGYRWKSLYRQDVQTVAVPIFSNKSFRQGVEFNLSKAVVNQLEAHTPYKVVSRDRADTILEGEITSIDVNTLSDDYNLDVPQEQMMTLRINFIWKDLRSGRILVERKAFEQTAAFYPTLGERQFVGNQQAVERLAVGIVQELQADW